MTNEYEIIQNTNYLLIKFPDFMRSISCAPLGQGILNVNNFINLKVPYNISKDTGDYPMPDKTLSDYCDKLGINPKLSVGMMTAADIETFSYAREIVKNFWVDAGVTVGLGNSRRAGEDADCTDIDKSFVPPAGTINIVVATNIRFTDAALVEAIALVAETKAKVIMDAGVVSTKNGRVATGTGTDAIAVLSRIEGDVQHYCGKHVITGQMVSRAVDSALKIALDKYYKIVEEKPWIRQVSL